MNQASFDKLYSEKNFKDLYAAGIEIGKSLGQSLTAGKICEDLLLLLQSSALAWSSNGEKDAIETLLEKYKKLSTLGR